MHTHPRLAVTPDDIRIIPHSITVVREPYFLARTNCRVYNLFDRTTAYFRILHAVRETRGNFCESAIEITYITAPIT